MGTGRSADRSCCSSGSDQNFQDRRSAAVDNVHQRVVDNFHQRAANISRPSQGYRRKARV